MQLILITPGNKPEVYSVIDANKQKLINTVQKLNIEITDPRKRKTTSSLNPALKLYEWMLKPF